MATRTIGPSNAEHYTWGDNCDGWYLVRNDALHIIEELMPPGTGETRHFHRQARQFFYVLQGELTMEVEGQSIIVNSREGIEIAPGQRHQAMNRSAAPVRFLVTSQPPSHEDRFPG